MKKIMILVAAAAMAIAPMTASAGRVFVGGGFYGPWGPYWGPAYGYGYLAPAMGEVKIDTKSKDAEVFVNGAFAGMTKNAKTMHLAPGTYNIEVRQGGQPVLSQQVYVAAGHTLHLHPSM